MLRFKKNVEERKLLAARLGELTGIHPEYTRAPLYAYRVGSYMVDREGDLYVDEEQADAEILQTLLREEMISEERLWTKQMTHSPRLIEVQAGEPEHEVGTGISSQETEDGGDHTEEDAEMSHPMLSQKW